MTNEGQFLPRSPAEYVLLLLHVLSALTDGVRRQTPLPRLLFQRFMCRNLLIPDILILTLLVGDPMPPFLCCSV